MTNAIGQPIIRVEKTERTGRKPNSIYELYSKKGGVTRDYYDEQGRWRKQITNHDQGNPKEHPFGKNGEHAHDIVWITDTKMIRSKAREMTAQERKENADIL